jgi:hypothetical protein
VFGIYINKLLKDSNMKSLKVLCLVLFLSIIFLKSSLVNAEEIKMPLITMFNKVIAIDKNQDVPARVFKKFTPYKVIVSNSGQSDAELNYNDTTAVFLDGTEEIPVSKSDVFKNAKVPVLKRSLIVGIPITIITLGFATIPVVGTLYALDVDANNTFKKELDALYFEKLVLKPNEEKTFYIFLPKKSSAVKDIFIKQN